MLSIALAAIGAALVAANPLIGSTPPLSPRGALRVERPGSDDSELQV